MRPSASPVLGHDRLKTFGVGTELDRAGWLSVIRQLLAQGHLLPDPDGHGGLVLAPAAAEVLRGNREVRLRSESAACAVAPQQDRAKGAVVAELDRRRRSCGRRCAPGGSTKPAARNCRLT